MLLEEEEVSAHSGQLRKDPGAVKRGAAGYQALISWLPELGPGVRKWTSHSGFESNLDQFSFNQKCNFCSQKLFVMAKLGLLGISY